MARKRGARVTKRTPPSSSRMTRQRSSRLVAEASSSSSLGHMVDGMMLSDTMDISSDPPVVDTMDEDSDGYIHVDHTTNHASNMEMESQEDSDLPFQPMDKGKGRAMDAEVKEEKCFRLMDLPTEIRLEIYRACLTRPYKIMLSKKEKTHFIEDSTKKADVDESDADDERTEERQAAVDVHQAARQHQGPSTATHPRPDASRGRRATLTNGIRSWVSQAPRIRAQSTRSSAGSDTTNSVVTSIMYPHGSGSAYVTASSSPARERRSTRRGRTDEAASKTDDPLIVNILRTSKLVYKEARDVLYSENVFDLNINTAVNSLAALHQRSRRHIKHAELEIPTYTEILESFSEVVRLSLRYCSGLKKFIIHTPFVLPGADGGMSSSNTTVYANGFDILRWLPQQCEVILEGNHNSEIETVVSKHLRLAKSQDKLAYARRQLISNESERTT